MALPSLQPYRHHGPQLGKRGCFTGPRREGGTVDRGSHVFLRLSSEGGHWFLLFIEYFSFPDVVRTHSDHKLSTMCREGLRVCVGGAGVPGPGSSVPTRHAQLYTAGRHTEAQTFHNKHNYISQISTD